MTRCGKRCTFGLKVFRYVMILFFTAGFVYQTLEFLFLYWTYPTVVDIQQSSPSYLKVPAFTFCNRVGYFYKNICDAFPAKTCANAVVFAPMIGGLLCGVFPELCYNGSIPDDFKKFIFYGKFMERNSIQRHQFPLMSIPLKNYLNCTIENAGNITSCNMDNVLGSFYTLDDLPQFCYTIYSKWGQPNKTRDLIPKGATMRFKLFLNITQRPFNESDPEMNHPQYNPPCNPSVQIAVHSPYFLPSPYLVGSSFKGGRSYELRIKLSESHLLPLPYQTNCTDYMTTWNQRGGQAPINQLNVIQECRINKTYEKIGCIPVNMDYPHPYNICKSCPNYQTQEPCNLVEPPNDCALLADSYNQPCNSMTYIVTKEDKAITFLKQVKSLLAHPSDGIRAILSEYDCEGKKLWNPECSTIDVDVPFDQFEITNMTYNPKFESLEVFSVIGGYMGMWLGISLLAVYDVIFDALVLLRTFLIKRINKKTKLIKVKPEKGQAKKRRRMVANDYDIRYASQYEAW